MKAGRGLCHIHEGDFPIYQSRFLDFSDLFAVCLFVYFQCVCSAISTKTSCSEYARLCQWISHRTCTGTHTFISHMYTVHCVCSSLVVIFSLLLSFSIFGLEQHGEGGRSMKKNEWTHIRKWLSVSLCAPFHFVYFFHSFIPTNDSKKGEKSTKHIENVFQYIFMHNAFNNRSVICCARRRFPMCTYNIYISVCTNKMP